MKKFKLHFVGIGGIGMSGIAEIFLSRGHAISGSDLQANEITERLVRLGATIEFGHIAENVKSVDVVVTSTAVKFDNPEILEAKRLGIPVIQRAEMLAEIMRGKIGIGIAGTHGKTTTTSMMAQIAMAAAFDPTVVVGGKVETIGSNAKSGEGDTVIVEADESDGSFHLLPCTYALITNIDLDHMEYYRSKKNLEESFIQFSKNVPFYGRTWLCGDDPGVKEVLPFLSKPYLTYGFESQNDVVAKNLKTLPNGKQSFDVWARFHKNESQKFLGEIQLSVLGRHNVLNALGAISLAIDLAVDLATGLPKRRHSSFEEIFKAVQTALGSFQHVRRRFDERFFSQNRKIRVIDDYGHHPTEIRAVLSTAKQMEHQRVVTVFQPHRYTRTQFCWKDFLTCFQDTDVLIILPIYGAGEEAIEGISSENLANELRKVRSVEVLENLEDAARWVLKNQKEGDLILTLGAGSITKLSDILAKELTQLFLSQI